MSDEQLTSVLESSGEERYDYFLSEVLEEREIWILVNSESRFLSIVSEDDGVAHLPVWPSSEFATAYAKGSDSLTPKSISLPDFFKKWVPGLSKDGLQVGVFPGLDKTVWITEADELKKDLQDELSNF
ncbi:MAG: DUF2750 domain-containing protein [Marinobacter sp.]|uniref:DUF2750 domain-containing protein n=1 Tax=Marinobacter sp. TaxID=50741 RepID=UPI001B52FCDF|nr:DUF2750 domain-containing protein [Marinobacter sp.]MBQ0748041.1 DUF2750 domain-containing protein [Marinobacter sp.]MBQ0815894.1 DUF2750 domain-containing protein [Marinobacter sp.]|tara:strand:+ start:210 stop:593 length:384 start_codon:yes stop_codon:yes gene_type:complete